MEDIFTALGGLTVICLVVFAAYYVTRFAADHARPGLGNLRGIRLLDRFVFSRDKMIVLVEVGGQVYMLGVTNQSINLIDTVEPGEFPEQRQRAGAVEGFGQLLTKLRRGAEDKTEPSNESRKEHRD